MSTENTDKLNVLVVVDVQNCFMANAFLDIEKNKDDAYEILHQPNIELCKKLASEVVELCGDNDLVVFTKDFHPIGHGSFTKKETQESDPPFTWPRHCRNTDSKCIDQEKTIDVPTEKENKKTLNNLMLKSIELKIPDTIPTDTPINGTDLSYFFYETDIANDIFNLNNKSQNKKDIIGLKSYDNNKSEPSNVQEKLPSTDEKINDKYVLLHKGEYCNYESYSAFNYHLHTPLEGDPKQITMSKDFSTGLWEYIIDQCKNQNKTNINITVCGLVGNVCVIHSVVQAMEMWNNLYSKDEDNSGLNATINYSLKGTLFVPEIGTAPAMDDKGTFTLSAFNPDPNVILNNEYGFIEEMQRTPWSYTNFDIVSGIAIMDKEGVVVSGKYFINPSKSQHGPTGNDTGNDTGDNPTGNNPPQHGGKCRCKNCCKLKRRRTSKRSKRTKRNTRKRRQKRSLKKRRKTRK